MPVPAPSPDARAVVTGASQNIGEALATELAARGHSLIITARREDILTDLAGRLTDKYGVAVEVRPADLADAAERAKLTDELATRDISILCANAGTATFGPVSTLDAATEKAQVQLNAIAVHELVLAVLPGMIERKAGGILISGSAAGNSPIPYNATYAATKAFVNTFSESLRGELRKSGVHVTLLAPGPVRTELPDPAESLDRREAGARFPVDLHRVHRTEVARCLGAQQDARRARRDVQGDVGGESIRPARYRRADRRKFLQKDGRLTYRRRRPLPPNMLRMSSVPSALRKVWKPRLFTKRFHRPGFLASAG